MRSLRPLRRLLLSCFVLLMTGLLALPAGAQRPKMKLDALGLPPFPGANSVGHINLPLGAILKPEPGQTMTGPKLNDLAIQTYRTPLTVSVERIANFYRKYAIEGGWRLLDDIADSATNRSLVFWSPAAPGYLTVEILPGPENTRQIDLTRLLGEVNPTRPGEVLRLTGKNVREQHVEAVYSGRFLDAKTNKFVRQPLRSVESRAEAGLNVDAVQWIAPISETYNVTYTVTDSTKRMTHAEAYSGNGTKIAEVTVPGPTDKLTLRASLRGGQGLMTRVVIYGIPPPPPPPVTPVTPTVAPGSPAAGPAAPATPAKPATPTAIPAAKPAAKTAAKPAAKTAAKTAAKPERKAPVKPATKAPAKSVPQPAAPVGPLKPVTGAGPAMGTPPAPGVMPAGTLPAGSMILTEVYGLRPPKTALAEIRRGAVSTHTEPGTPSEPVDVGSTCGQEVRKVVDWETETTDEATFPEDLFGNAFPRIPLNKRSATLIVDFPKGSGTVNTYTLTRAKTITTTQVQYGYSFNGTWIALPTKKANPVNGTYTTTVFAPPTVEKRSTGACPTDNGEIASPTDAPSAAAPPPAPSPSGGSPPTPTTPK